MRNAASMYFYRIYASEVSRQYWQVAEFHVPEELTVLSMRAV
jgi:hypothetical protein